MIAMPFFHAARRGEGKDDGHCYHHDDIQQIADLNVRHIGKTGGELHGAETEAGDGAADQSHAGDHVEGDAHPAEDPVLQNGIERGAGAEGQTLVHGEIHHDHAPEDLERVIQHRPVQGGLGYGGKRCLIGFCLNAEIGGRREEIAEGLCHGIEHHGDADAGADGHSDPGEGAVFRLGIGAADDLLAEFGMEDHVQQQTGGDEGNAQDQPVEVGQYGVENDSAGVAEAFPEEDTICKEKREDDRNGDEHFLI